MSQERKRNDFSSFIECSNNDYASAFAEISAGRKTSHWIWYIFPQLEFLGQSRTAIYFGIKDVSEAAHFLEDPVLGSRLVEISGKAIEKLKEGVPLKTLMGSAVDAYKLRSCATLFYYTTTLYSKNSNPLFKELLDLCVAQMGGEDDRSVFFCQGSITDLQASF